MPPKNIVLLAPMWSIKKPVIGRAIIPTIEDSMLSTEPIVERIFDGTNFWKYALCAGNFKSSNKTPATKTKTAKMGVVIIATRLSVIIFARIAMMIKRRSFPCRNNEYDNNAASKLALAFADQMYPK